MQLMSQFCFTFVNGHVQSYKILLYSVEYYVTICIQFFSECHISNVQLLISLYLSNSVPLFQRL